MRRLSDSALHARPPRALALLPRRQPAPLPGNGRHRKLGTPERQRTTGDSAITEGLAQEAHGQNQPHLQVGPECREEKGSETGPIAARQTLLKSSEIAPRI